MSSPYTSLSAHPHWNRGKTCPESKFEKERLKAEIERLHLPDNVKAIPLTKGRYALVDAEDYESLMQWEWSYRDGYAKRSQHVSLGNGLRKQIPITMHGTIMPAPNGRIPDHKNGDGTDNRKENLRPATQQQNMWNRKSVTNSISKYKGVSWRSACGYWVSAIKIGTMQLWIGCFHDEDDAARAWNKVAKQLHGEFARLNPVEDGLCLSQIVRKKVAKV